MNPSQFKMATSGSKEGTTLVAVFGLVNAHGLPASCYDGDNYYDEDYDEYAQPEKHNPVLLTPKQKLEFVNLCYYDKEIINRYIESIFPYGKSKYTKTYNNGEMWLVDGKVRHEEPHVCPELLKFFEKGGNIAIEKISDYMFGIIVGDLDNTMKPHIEEAVDNDECTYTVTNGNYIMQRRYGCRTCFGDEQLHLMAICPICADKCHRSHQLVELEKANCFCDCGADDTPVRCICMKKSK